MTRSRTPSEQRKVEDMRWKSHQYVRREVVTRKDMKPEDIYILFRRVRWL